VLRLMCEFNCLHRAPGNKPPQNLVWPKLGNAALINFVAKIAAA
jgi:hypothetical protein